MKLKFLPLFISCIFLFLSSCSNDGDDVVDNTVTPPSTYKFERDSKTTISYSGQTARLKMANELSSMMNSSTASQSGLDNMFNKGTGFTDTTLDATGKNVGGKTFASAIAASTVKPKFNAWIVDFISNVKPKMSSVASNGSAGFIQDAGSTKKRYFNDKGHELNQLFTKGLIGGMAADQIVNGYLSPAKLNGAKADNDAGTMYAEGKNYTAMEHYWDEGFGYLYGLEADETSPTLGATGDVLLNKYAAKIEASNSPGIAKIIYDAFIMGRAAIVAKNYTVRDEQAKIIQIHISKIIGYKAIDYLNSYVDTAKAGVAGVERRADAFHALSEGYGFVMSLQVTNDGTGKPYFTNAEVNTMLAKIENFWTVSSADCTAMAAEIKSKMNL